MNYIWFFIQLHAVRTQQGRQKEFSVKTLRSPLMIFYSNNFVSQVSQEERRILISKQEELEAELRETKAALEEKTKENETLTERIRLVCLVLYFQT